ncbi:MAG: F0F1 ATP synthase subunit B [Thermaerobacter sp.]|nr:F0F1 ATP synthase subunit B [Thermaerobacter sp.]
MSSTSLTLGNMVFAVVQWAILLILLRIWVYKPLLAAMGQRRENVAKQIRDADALRDEADRIRQEAQKLIAEARDEAKQIIAQAQREAGEQGKRIVTQAQREASYRQKAALEEIAHEQEVAVAAIRGQVADVVVAATRKLLARNLTGNDQQQFVQEILQDVGQLQ